MWFSCCFPSLLISWQTMSIDVLFFLFWHRFLSV
jgi:hypothetical protein